MPAAKLPGRLGTYVDSSVAGETVRAFIPPPLPPAPKLEFDGLYPHLERASQSLGRLNSFATYTSAKRPSSHHKLRARNRPLLICCYLRMKPHPRCRSRMLRKFQTTLLRCNTAYAG